MSKIVPFKGSQAYEIQIGSIVFSLLYPHSNMQPDRINWALKVWIDKHWNK